MNPKTNSASKNDNKALKEKGISNLLNALIALPGNALTKYEKIVIAEFLVHNRTFTEVEEKHQLTESLQKRRFEKGIRKIINNLQEMDERLMNCNHNHSDFKQLLNELTTTKLRMEMLKEIINEKQKLSPETQALLFSKLRELNISSRIKNACEFVGVHTLTDLVRLKRHEFVIKRNLGEKSAKEIDIFLKQYGLTWAMNI